MDNNILKKAAGNEARKKEMRILIYLCSKNIADLLRQKMECLEVVGFHGWSSDSVEMYTDFKVNGLGFEAMLNRLEEGGGQFTFLTIIATDNLPPGGSKNWKTFRKLRETYYKIGGKRRS